MADLSAFAYKLKIENAQIGMNNLQVFLSLWLENEKDDETAPLLAVALTVLDDIKKGLDYDSNH